ncbi:MAG: winged helix-turn-helix domain-containing protein [Thermoproteota archaeon]|nr:winged helix-turn-helix domain-containing protein [Thermoproteota archaeon]
MLGRHRTEIIAQILEVVNDGSSSSNGGEGVTRTKIMYKAFLSYAQLKEYLAILTHNGLLSFDDGTQTFKTTEKGLKFLKAYGQLDQLTNK